MFKELELDCDEQIKQLDESERAKKHTDLEQKQILDSLKLKCQLRPDSFKFKSKSTRHSSKCQCFSQSHRGQQKRKKRGLINRKTSSRSQLTFVFVFIKQIHSTRLCCFRHLQPRVNRKFSAFLSSNTSIQLQRKIIPELSRRCYRYV